MVEDTNQFISAHLDTVRNKVLFMNILFSKDSFFDKMSHLTSSVRNYMHEEFLLTEKIISWKIFYFYCHVWQPIPSSSEMFRNGYSTAFLLNLVTSADCTIIFKGTKDWEFFWLRFWNLHYFFVSYVKILRFYPKKFLIGPLLGEVRFFRVVLGLRRMKKIFEVGQNFYFYFLQL